MKSESFVFRGEWMNVISDLPDDIRLEVYDAVIRYGISGETIELKPMAKIAFGFMKMAIDKDKEAYSRRSEAGSRGGRPRKEETDENQEKPNETNENQTKPKKTNENQEKPNGDDGFDCLCDNDNVNDNVIIEKVPKGTKKKAASAAERAEALKAAAKRLTDEVYATDYPDSMKQAFCIYWTEPNQSRTKLRYQLEKTWDTSRRLATWASRDKVAKVPRQTEIGRTEFSHNYSETW